MAQYYYTRRTATGTEGTDWTKLSRALFVEFLGTLLFQFIGGSATGWSWPLANGLGYAVAIYLAGNISGGHLNPAVSIGAMIGGFIPALDGFLYIVSQILGAVVGALLTGAVVPHAHIGSSVNAPGAYFLGGGVTGAQGFGWEVILTFLLVLVFAATALTQPNFGNVAPLAIGLTLLAAATSAGGYTGASLNPARYLAPALVFHAWNHPLTYLLAQLLGAALAGAASYVLYGPGPQFVGETSTVAYETIPDTTVLVDTTAVRAGDKI